MQMVNDGFPRPPPYGFKLVETADLARVNGIFTANRMQQILDDFSTN
jgi:hypothetical protein